MKEVKNFTVFKNDKKEPGSNQPDHSLALSYQDADENWHSVYLSSWKKEDDKPGITGGQGYKDGYEDKPSIKLFVQIGDGDVTQASGDDFKALDKDEF